MDDCKRLQKIQEVLDELAGRAGQGAIILVEGRRDRESLDALGIRGRIVMTSQEQLFNLAERVAGEKDVIVLSDWDERGGRSGEEGRGLPEVERGQPGLRAPKEAPAPDQKGDHGSREPARLRGAAEAGLRT